LKKEEAPPGNDPCGALSLRVLADCLGGDLALVLLREAPEPRSGGLAVDLAEAVAGELVDVVPCRRELLHHVAHGVLGRDAGLVHRIDERIERRANRSRPLEELEWRLLHEVDRLELRARVLVEDQCRRLEQLRPRGNRPNRCSAGFP